MPSADVQALEHLREIQKNSRVHGVVHLVAVAADDNPETFEVELVGSIHDPSMVWTMVCAARAALQDEYGFTDRNAAREIEP